MNILFLLTACITIYFNNNAVAEDCALLSKEIEKNWCEFKKNYSKTYSKKEEDTRKKIFSKNYYMIKEHNNKYDRNEVNFSMKMNQFGDLEHSEFLEIFDNTCSTKIDEMNDVYDYDNNLDTTQIQCEWQWNDKYYFTKMRDQGKCANGWAISAIAALEIRYKIMKNLSNNHFEPWSVDYVRHCCDSFHCKVRKSSEVCEFLKQTPKIPTEESYNRHKSCDVSRSEKANFSIVNCVNVSHKNKNYETIKELISKQGPVAASIYAKKPSFQFAEKGIYDDIDCSGSPNHEVVIVGFGEENGHKYWIAQNSFGSKWGNNGYFKISDKQTKNKCRILRSISYPELSRTSLMKSDYFKHNP